jgi:hypothetical protein
MTEFEIRNSLRIYNTTSTYCYILILLTLLSEPAPFLRDPLIKNLQKLLIRYRIITLPSLSYTSSETYSILFHLADPDFWAPHLLNTRGGYQGPTTGRTSVLLRKRRRRRRGRSYHNEITRGGRRKQFTYAERVHAEQVRNNSLIENSGGGLKIQEDHNSHPPQKQIQVGSL